MLNSCGIAADCAVDGLIWCGRLSGTELGSNEEPVECGFCSNGEPIRQLREPLVSNGVPLSAVLGCQLCVATFCGDKQSLSTLCANKATTAISKATNHPQGITKCAPSTTE